MSAVTLPKRPQDSIDVSAWMVRSCGGVGPRLFLRRRQELYGCQEIGDALLRI